MQCSACARYVVCFPWAINSYTLGNTGVGVHAVRAIHVAYFYYIEYMHIIINIAFSSLLPLPPDSYSNLYPHLQAMNTYSSVQPPPILLIIVTMVIIITIIAIVIWTTNTIHELLPLKV